MYSQFENMTEQELFLCYEKKQENALREYILKKYLYIAEIVAKKYMNRGVEYDDLFQLGSLALIKAVDRYQCARGVKFASFATPTLIGEVKNYFRDKTRMIRISRRDSEQIRNLNDAKETLMGKLGRSVTPEEIAGYIQYPVERVLELMEARSVAYTSSLDSYIAVDEDARLIKLLGCMDNEYEKIEDRDFIDYCLGHLNEVERQVIEERYVHDKSQREVATILGVSQMYISRIERKILGKFRNYYEK